VTKKAKIRVYNEVSGAVMARVEKGTTTVFLDLNDCCILADKVDTFLFGKAPANRRIRNTQFSADLQPMSKEEMHDLLYSYSYEDGNSLSKAMSIKLVGLIDTNKITTYAGLLCVYGKVISKKSVIKHR
jgi:hypothetical protein